MFSHSLYIASITTRICSHVYGMLNEVRFGDSKFTICFETACFDNVSYSDQNQIGLWGSN